MSIATDEAVSQRLRQERLRLGLAHSEVARLSGYSRNSVMAWEKGTTVPATALGVLSTEGFDAQYVCTGVRSANAGQVGVPGEAGDALTGKEWRLVKRYRALGDAQQAQALAMLEVLAAGMPVGGGSGNTVVVSGKGQKVAGGNFIKKQIVKGAKD